LVVWGVSAVVREFVGIEGFVNQLIVVAAPVLFGAATYIGTAILLGVEEMTLIKGIVGRRLGGGKPSAPA
jgi:hypothetical protein